MSEQQSRVKPLSAEEVRFDFDLATIERCKRVGSNEVVVGQPRALRSLELGLSIPKSGYNIFVSGDSEADAQGGTAYHRLDGGDTSSLRDILYVYNFGQPDSPMLLTWTRVTERLVGKLYSFTQDLLCLIAPRRSSFPVPALVDQLAHSFSFPQQTEYFNGLRSEMTRLQADRPPRHEAVKGRPLPPSTWRTSWSTTPIRRDSRSSSRAPSTPTSSAPSMARRSTPTSACTPALFWLQAAAASSSSRGPAR